MMSSCVLLACCCAQLQMVFMCMGVDPQSQYLSAVDSSSASAKDADKELAAEIESLPSEITKSVRSLFESGKIAEHSSADSKKVINVIRTESDIIIRRLAFTLHLFIYDRLSFSALTLLVRHQEERPACKNSVMRCRCGYLAGARCRLFAYATDATAIPKTPSSLASFKSRLVLPFWYRFTQAVVEKRPLNGCSK